MNTHPQTGDAMAAPQRKPGTANARVTNVNNLCDRIIAGEREETISRWRVYCFRRFLIAELKRREAFTPEIEQWVNDMIDAATESI